MRRIYSVIAGLFFIASVFAQVPQKMSYQAVIRNNSNTLITSTPVGMKISILQGSSSGTAVYAEIQTTNTNANGLVSLEIGSGTVVTGTFADIDWATGSYFIKTETDPAGGTTYTIVGTSELMSVPYSLFSAKVTPVVSGFTHYLGEAFNGGIIFYLYKGSDGLEHGLIVALTEKTVVWQQPATLVNANRSEDGAYNTVLMTGSQAATYIATLGVGWFLPSIDELGLLYYNRYSAQKGLRAGGNTLLFETTYYWSSTEYNATNAYYFFVTNSNFSYGVKYFSLTARGVKAF